MKQLVSSNGNEAKMAVRSETPSKVKRFIRRAADLVVKTGRSIVGKKVEAPVRPSLEMPPQMEPLISDQINKERNEELRIQLSRWHPVMKNHVKKIVYFEQEDARGVTGADGEAAGLLDRYDTIWLSLKNSFEKTLHHEMGHLVFNYLKNDSTSKNKELVLELCEHLIKTKNVTYGRIQIYYNFARTFEPVFNLAEMLILVNTKQKEQLYNLSTVFGYETPLRHFLTDARLDFGRINDEMKDRYAKLRQISFELYAIGSINCSEKDCLDYSGIIERTVPLLRKRDEILEDITRTAIIYSQLYGKTIEAIKADRRWREDPTISFNFNVLTEELDNLTIDLAIVYKSVDNLKKLLRTEMFAALISSFMTGYHGKDAEQELNVDELTLGYLERFEIDGQKIFAENVRNYRAGTNQPTVIQSDWDISNIECCERLPVNPEFKNEQPNE
ncbi:MAG: hypothetical protein V1492_01835 [Candidatus Micrarchaeota archaeon]